MKKIIKGVNIFNELMTDSGTWVSDKAGFCAV